MINKYQQGGSIMQKVQAMPEKLKKAFLNQFAQWAQANGIDIRQLTLNPQAMEQAMQAFVDSLSGGQQTQQQLSPVAAKFGTKLNYIRSLKGACPEGQEIKYFKQGGQMKCKCVDKAAGGEKVKDGKKEIADFKKKKACGGLKAKFADGGKPKADNKKWTEKDDKKLLKYRLKGTKNPAEKRDSTEVQTKWNKLPEKEKAKYEVKEKCGGKVKKHQQGGSLNGIPFIKLGVG